MKSVWKVCPLFFLAAALCGQTAPAAKAKKVRPAPITAADIQALKDAMSLQDQAIAAQQKQIQALMDQLKQKDQAVQQAQTVATDAAGKADAAQTVATQQQTAVGALQTEVTDLKGTVSNTVTSLQDTQNRMTESPMALHFKGITITPGGFLAAETVRRSRALGADVNSPLNSVTMPGASQSTLSEFFGSGRQSRVSMLAEGKLASAKISGYVEADFLSAGITSNNNQSNSYTLRQRQAWGQAAFDNGWSITGGQMWSLMTETKHGVDNRTEALPMTIDAQYTAGFSWARQFGLRLAKGFNNKVWLALSVENPQATVTTHGNATNYLIGSAGAGGGLYNSGVTNCTTTIVTGTSTPLTTCSLAASYAFNPSPDIIGKLVFEPGFGHYEIFGVYARFRDRVFPCADVALTGTCDGVTGPSVLGAFNSSKNGGGWGANARWSFFNKHIDFGLHGLAGNGIGRYGSAGLPDVSVRADGTLNMVRSYQGLSTLEWHGPKVDLYFNVGAEYAGRAADFDTVTGKPVGYGNALFNNSGCSTETLPVNNGGFLPGGLGGCTADTRVLIEGTSGFWFKVYDGSKDKINRGRVQWGAQYSYVTRNTWSGGTPIALEPHGIDGMIFTSFRYYLP